MSDLLSKYSIVLGTLANIATAVAVWYAYRQYKHSVILAEKNENRAAIELAARECTNYGSVLLPQFQSLRKDIEGSGCKFFQHFRLIREEKDLKPDASVVTEEDYNILNKHTSETIRLFNTLEGFSIPFAAGVAHSRVGFMECGRSFVNLFEQFFGLYARHDLKVYYPSTQILYWKWRKEIVEDDRRRLRLQTSREFFTMTEAFIHDATDSKVLRGAISWLKKKAWRE